MISLKELQRIFEFLSKLAPDIKERTFDISDITGYVHIKGRGSAQWKEKIGSITFKKGQNEEWLLYSLTRKTIEDAKV
jgi:hypothetical protein